MQIPVANSTKLKIKKFKQMYQENICKLQRKNTY